MRQAFTTAQECEIAFYAAFDACDLHLMKHVWASHTALLCVHPGGPVLLGRDAVMSSWQQIFAGPGSLRFILSDHQIFEQADMAVRFVHENIHHGSEMHELSVVLATNVFVREGSGWKLCSHHASSAPSRVSAPRQHGPHGTRH